MALVAKRLEHIPNSDPLAERVISDNGFCTPNEGSAEEINIIGRIRWREPLWVCRSLQLLKWMEHHEQDREQVFS